MSVREQPADPILDPGPRDPSTPSTAGGEWRRLQQAVGGLCPGASVSETLDLVLRHAAGALPAAGHLLDVELADGGRQTRATGTAGRVLGGLPGGCLPLGSSAVEGAHVVTVPLVTETRTYGVLAAVASDSAPFDPADGDVLATYARHAAGCIQMAQLLEAAHAEERTARLLLRVARSLAGRHTETEICQLIAEAARAQLGANRGAVALWNEEAGDVRVVGRSGWQDCSAARAGVFTTMTNDSPELWQLLADGAPMLVDGRSSAWSRAVLSHFGLTAAAAVPMVLDGALVGVIVAAWSGTTPPASLGEASSERLWGLAGLTMVALDNASLLEEMRRQVSHDGLTQLPNRGLFEERVQRELSGAGQLAVILGDVSRLSRVNDSLGPSAGDELLRQIARRLRRVVREQDTVARYSGKEFAVLLPGVDQREAERVAERVRAVLAPPMRIDGNDIYAELTLGVAVADGSDGRTRHRDGWGTVRQLVERATDDIHRNRARARGQVTVDATSAEGLRLEAALHGALSRGEVFVDFQPQIDIGRGVWVAVEALARWKHPTLGLVSPERFVPLAEESGLIAEIGEFVLRVACRTVGAWRRDGLIVEVAVNVSAVQLNDPGFTTLVQQVLMETGLPPEQLTLEVTEGQVLTELATHHGHLQLLRDLGTGISVDDFGTGYSSLAQLHRLPVTEVKIDRSFISRLADEQSEAFAAGIIGLGQGLGLRVVAEGVETTGQLDALRRLGCERAQGYLISPPRQPEALRSAMAPEGLSSGIGVASRPVVVS